MSVVAFVPELQSSPEGSSGASVNGAQDEFKEVEVSVLAEMLSNNVRFDNEGTAFPYFRFFEGMEKELIEVWLAELQTYLKLEDIEAEIWDKIDPVRPNSREINPSALGGNTSRTEAQNHSKPANEFTSSFIDIKSLQKRLQANRKMRLQRVDRGSTLCAHRFGGLYLIMDGVMLLYVAARYHQFRHVVREVDLRQTNVNGRLRFPGDVIGEHGFFYPATDETSYRSLRHQALKPALLLRLPYSFLRESHHPISAIIVDQLPRAIVTKIRRDEQLGVRLFSLEGSNWYAAVLLHLLCQFGHPALLPSNKDKIPKARAIESYKDPMCRKIVRSLVAIDLDVNQTVLSCLHSSKPHNTAARSERVSFDRGVALHGEGVKKSVDEFIHTCFKEINDGKGATQKQLDMIRDGLDKADRLTKGDKPTFKGCVIFLPNMLPPELFRLFAREYRLDDPCGWPVLRKRLREVVKAARLSFTHPSRFAADLEQAEMLEPEFRELFKHWAVRGRSPSEVDGEQDTKGSGGHRKPISLPPISELSREMKAYVQVNGGFHVRRAPKEEFAAALEMLSKGGASWQQSDLDGERDLDYSH